MGLNGARQGFQIVASFENGNQAFEGYTGNRILVTGVPDDAASLPHSSPKHRL